jgi:PncC family amidohydrolase
MEVAERVHALLQQRGETVATAESLTGGRLAAALTAVPGASQSYVGGVVAYATAV